MLASYHTHIADSGLDSMVVAAARSGMSVLGISEHADRLRAPGALEDYRAQVRFAGAPGLGVRLGVEADFVPGVESAVADLLAGPGWDFVLGAVHRIGGAGLGDVEAGDLGSGWALWREYCGLQRQAVASGLFDVLAHPLRLAGRVPPPPYLDQLFAPVLEAAAAAGVAVELHGGDLGWAPAWHRNLVAWCHRSGVAVTLGAGAHRPEEVARNLEAAGALLRREGFASATGFRARHPVGEPLAAPGAGYGRNCATGMR